MTIIPLAMASLKNKAFIHELSTGSVRASERLRMVLLVESGTVVLTILAPQAGKAGEMKPKVAKTYLVPLADCHFVTPVDDSWMAGLDMPAAPVAEKAAKK